MQQIIDFSKMVPGFMQLSQDDQIALLKSASYGIMLLYASQHHYLPERHSLLYNQHLLPIDSLLAHLASRLDPHELLFLKSNLDFMRQLRQFALSDSELALLSAIVLFNPTEGHSAAAG